MTPATPLAACGVDVVVCMLFDLTPAQPWYSPGHQILSLPKVEGCTFQESTNHLHDNFHVQNPSFVLHTNSDLLRHLQL